MIAMKFGGTSVGSAERIKNTCNIIKSKLEDSPKVVVSAVSGMTNMLIELANETSSEKRKEIFEKIKGRHIQILSEMDIENSLLEKNLNEFEKIVNEIQDKEVDVKTFEIIQSFGERMSSKIVAAQLNKMDIKAGAFNSYDLGFVTDDNFGNAEPLEKTYGNLKNEIGKIDVLPVITGFLGKTESGEITTIGRGGSDYTAAIVGSAIGAKEIQIWTDVNGIMTTDPKIVPTAKTISEVSFAEASELAYFGARVLHPKSIVPAMNKNIPVRVLNSFEPENKGTTIVNKAENGSIVRSISCKKNITLVNIQSTRMLGAHGFLAKLFTTFENYKKSVDVIATSEVSVSLTVGDNSNMAELVKELEEIADIKILKNKSIICVIGEGMRCTPGISGRTFSTIGKENINIEMVSQGASEINITFIVDGKDTDKAVHALHNEYFGK